MLQLLAVCCCYAGDRTEKSSSFQNKDSLLVQFIPHFFSYIKNVVWYNAVEFILVKTPNSTRGGFIFHRRINKKLIDKFRVYSHASK